MVQEAIRADAVSGADAIEAYWQSFFDLGIAGAQPTTEEVIPMGEYALETGQYSVFGKDGRQLDRGKIMVLWKNEGGAWKMHRDTWNSSVSQPSGRLPLAERLRWLSDSG